MGGFFGWFLVIVVVLAIFNAERLPELREMIEQKLKTSVDAAKEGSKTVKQKIEKVKTDIDNRKNMPEAEKESEVNTPEETEEALQFMSSYIEKNETKELLSSPQDDDEEIYYEMPTFSEENTSEENDDEEKPIDLDNRD